MPAQRQVTPGVGLTISEATPGQFIIDINPASDATALTGTDNTQPMTAATSKATRPYLLGKSFVTGGVMDFAAAYTALSSDPTTPDTIVMPKGTYLATTTIDWRGKSYRIEAEGFRIESAQTIVMQAGGAAIALATSTVVGNLAAGATSITVVNGALFTVGDVIRLRSSGEVYNDDRPTVHFKGELALIVGVVGNVLSLLTGLDDSYDATTYTVNVDRVDARTPRITGLEILGTGAGQHGLLVESFLDARVEGVRFDGCDVRGMVANYGLGITVAEATAVGCNDATTGYGIQIGDVDGATVRDSDGRNNRHSFEVGGEAPSRNVTFSSCRAKGDSSAGLSSHGGSDRIVFRDCSADWCGGGFIIRGSNTTIEGGAVRGTHARSGSYVHGIRGGDDTPNDKGNGRGGKGLRVSGVHVDLRGHGLAQAVYGMYLTCAVDDAKITRATFKGHSAHGMWFSGDTHRDLVVAETHIDSTLVTQPNSYGILIVPSTNISGNNVRGARFAFNRVVGDGGTNVISGIRVHGNFDAAARADRLTYIGNDIEAVGRGIEWAGGGFFHRARAEGNTFTSVAAPFVYTAGDFDLTPIIVPNYQGDARVGIVGYATAAPTTGTWRVGDVVLNSLPAAGGVPGWVCTTAGTPGVWKAMAVLAA